MAGAAEPERLRRCFTSTFSDHDLYNAIPIEFRPRLRLATTDSEHVLSCSAASGRRPACAPPGAVHCGVVYELNVRYTNAPFLLSKEALLEQGALVAALEGLCGVAAAVGGVRTCLAKIEQYISVQKKRESGICTCALLGELAFRPYKPRAETCEETISSASPVNRLLRDLQFLETRLEPFKNSEIRISYNDLQFYLSQITAIGLEMGSVVVPQNQGAIAAWQFVRNLQIKLLTIATGLLDGVQYLEQNGLAAATAAPVQSAADALLLLAPHEDGGGDDDQAALEDLRRRVQQLQFAQPTITSSGYSSLLPRATTMSSWLELLKREAQNPMLGRKGARYLAGAIAVGEYMEAGKIYALKDIDAVWRGSVAGTRSTDFAPLLCTLLPVETWRLAKRGPAFIKTFEAAPLDALAATAAPTPAPTMSLLMAVPPTRQNHLMVGLRQFLKSSPAASASAAKAAVGLFGQAVGASPLLISAAGAGGEQRLARSLNAVATAKSTRAQAQGPAEHRRLVAASLASPPRGGRVSIWKIDPTLVSDLLRIVGSTRIDTSLRDGRDWLCLTEAQVVAEFQDLIAMRKPALTISRSSIRRTLHRLNITKAPTIKSRPEPFEEADKIRISLQALMDATLDSPNVVVLSCDDLHKIMLGRLNTSSNKKFLTVGGTRPTVPDHEWPAITSVIAKITMVVTNRTRANLDRRQHGKKMVRFVNSTTFQTMSLEQRNYAREHGLQPTEGITEKRPIEMAGVASDRGGPIVVTLRPSVVGDSSISQESTPYQHVVDTVQLLNLIAAGNNPKLNALSDFVTGETSTCARVTDGGKDQDVTRLETHVSLLHLLSIGDFSSIVAVHSAPYHSKTNMVERGCRSVNQAIAGLFLKPNLPPAEALVKVKKRLDGKTATHSGHPIAPIIADAKRDDDDDVAADESGLFRPEDVAKFCAIAHKFCRRDFHLFFRTDSAKLRQWNAMVALWAAGEFKGELQFKLGASDIRKYPFDGAQARVFAYLGGLWAALDRHRTHFWTLGLILRACQDADCKICGARGKQHVAAGLDFISQLEAAAAQKSCGSRYCKIDCKCTAAAAYLAHIKAEVALDNGGRRRIQPTAHPLYCLACGAPSHNLRTHCPEVAAFHGSKRADLQELSTMSVELAERDASEDGDDLADLDELERNYERTGGDAVTAVAFSVPEEREGLSKKRQPRSMQFKMVIPAAPPAPPPAPPQPPAKAMRLPTAAPTGSEPRHPAAAPPQSAMQPPAAILPPPSVVPPTSAAPRPPALPATTRSLRSRRPSAAYAPPTPAVQPPVATATQPTAAASPPPSVVPPPPAADEDEWPKTEAAALLADCDIDDFARDDLEEDDATAISVHIELLAAERLHREEEAAAQADDVDEQHDGDAGEIVPDADVASLEARHLRRQESLQQRAPGACLPVRLLLGDKSRRSTTALRVASIAENLPSFLDASTANTMDERGMTAAEAASAAGSVAASGMITDTVLTSLFAPLHYSGEIVYNPLAMERIQTIRSDLAFRIFLPDIGIMTSAHFDAALHNLGLDNATYRDLTLDFYTRRAVTVAAALGGSLERMVSEPPGQPPPPPREVRRHPLVQTLLGAGDRLQGQIRFDWLLDFARFVGQQVPVQVLDQQTRIWLTHSIFHDVYQITLQQTQNFAALTRMKRAWRDIASAHPRYVAFSHNRRQPAHWAMFLYDRGDAVAGTTPTLELFDSMGGCWIFDNDQQAAARCAEDIVWFLRSELDLPAPARLDIVMPSGAERLQTGGLDCGRYAFLYAVCRVRGLSAADLHARTRELRAALPHLKDSWASQLRLRFAEPPRRAREVAPAAAQPTPPSPPRPQPEGVGTRTVPQLVSDDECIENSGTSAAAAEGQPAEAPSKRVRHLAPQPPAAPQPPPVSVGARRPATPPQHVSGKKTRVQSEPRTAAATAGRRKGRKREEEATAAGNFG